MWHCVVEVVATDVSKEYLRKVGSYPPNDNVLFQKDFSIKLQENINNYIILSFIILKFE
jgi:hypothetical protein